MYSFLFIYLLYRLWEIVYESICCPTFFSFLLLSFTLFWLGIYNRTFSRTNIFHRALLLDVCLGQYMLIWFSSCVRPIQFRISFLDTFITSCSFLHKKTIEFVFPSKRTFCSQSIRLYSSVLKNIIDTFKKQI